MADGWKKSVALVDWDQVEPAGIRVTLGEEYITVGPAVRVPEDDIRQVESEEIRWIRQIIDQVSGELDLLNSVNHQPRTPSAVPTARASRSRIERSGRVRTLPRR